MESVAINVDDYDKMKKYIKKVVGHGPAEKLRKLIQRNLFINTVQKKRITKHAFEKLIKAFIKLYYTSTDLKGDVIKYLKSEKCMEPKGKSVSDHQDRMKEIMT